MKSLEEQLLSIREAEQSAKIQSISDMPKSGKQMDLSDYMIKVDEIFTKIVRKRSECLKRKIEIESMITDLDDGIESMILHKKYIECKSWEQICIEIDYEWAQTHRKHALALSHLKMIHNDT